MATDEDVEFENMGTADILGTIMVGALAASGCTPKEDVDSSCGCFGRRLSLKTVWLLWMLGSATVLLISFWSMNSEDVQGYYGRVNSKVYNVFPGDATSTRGLKDGLVQRALQRPAVGVCTLDDCNTDLTATCSVAATVSSAYGVRSLPTTPCTVNAALGGCFTWYTGDKHRCTFFELPVNYTDYNGKSQPFYFYRYEAPVTISATVTGSMLNAVSVGLFDPIAKQFTDNPTNNLRQAAYTMDWVSVPVGRMSDVSVKSVALQIDEGIGKPLERTDKLRRDFQFTVGSFSNALVAADEAFVVLRAAGDESTTLTQLQNWARIDYFNFIGGVMGFIDMFLGLAALMFFVLRVWVSNKPADKTAASAAAPMPFVNNPVHTVQ